MTSPTSTSPSAPSRPIAWQDLLADSGRAMLTADGLPQWMKQRRWFAGKAKGDCSFKIAESFPIGSGEDAAHGLFVEVQYAQGGRETYFVPVQLAFGEAARRLAAERPASIVRQWDGAVPAVLHDAIDDASFREALFALMAESRSQPAGAGEITGLRGHTLGAPPLPPQSRTLQAEQSNSAVIYENRWFLKIYRKLEDGVNPDAEIVRYLSEVRGFSQVPAFSGALEYRRQGLPPRALGLMAPLLSQTGDAWAHTLEQVRQCYAQILAMPSDAADAGRPMAEFGSPDWAGQVQLLARRTAEMHLALAAPTDDPAFAPEPLDLPAQRAMYGAMEATTHRMISVLAAQQSALSGNEALTGLAALEPKIRQLQSRLLDHPIEACVTRTHGDYHLGQVLFDGKDFLILDFEGEPARSLAERRQKRSPLRDVAGMLRSFHYAAYAALWQGQWSTEEQARLEPWAERWAEQAIGLFRDAYLATTPGASFLPPSQDDLKLLIQTHLLEKAAYEVVYELNHRPHWAIIPARGIRRLLGH